MHSLPKLSPLQVLELSAVLDALGATERSELAAVSRVVRARRGEVLWANGALTDFFGVSADGFVKMVRSCANGTDVTLELMGPGQVFGLMGTVTETGCPLSAIAVTDLNYLRIPKTKFLEIYRRSMPLKDQLIKKTALRLHGFVDFMARLSSGRIDERIAANLFILAESYGHRKNGVLSLEVPLTRQEIAEMAGTTVESTIRTMSKWQKAGLITTNQHLITILDEKSLQAVL